MRGESHKERLIRAIVEDFLEDLCATACCGVGEIVSTGDVLGCARAQGVSAEKILRGLRRRAFYAFLLATTTQHQRGEARVLRSAGFRRCARARRNPNSGNKVTVWIATCGGRK